MSPRTDTYVQVYLNPGELVVCDQPSVVSTVLGSCVSVTLLHRRNGVGAICHGLLPDCKSPDGCMAGCKEGARYMKCAIRTMIAAYRERGIPLSELEVKIFGGSDMFRGAFGLRNTLNVGPQNIRAALATLGEYGLHPVTSDTGGGQGRKLFFISNTGEVYLKRLGRNERMGQVA